MVAALAEKPKFFSLQFSVKRSKVRREDLMVLSRQLAAFVRGGIPILTALDVLRESTDNPTLHRVLTDLGRSLQLGAPFSDAIGAHPKVFPAFYRSMIESAELTGRLPEVLDQMAIYMERDLEARRKVRAALTYPAVVMIMAVGTVVILTGWVLPKFKTFFISLHAKLPLTTRIMLASTNWIGQWWYAIVAGAALLAVGYKAAMRTSAGRRMRDTAVLRLPIVGRLTRTSILERFCRLLGSLLTAGVSLPHSLVVTGDATNNVLYKAALDKVRGAMLQGDGLAGPIAQTQLFPNAAVQMLRVGEKTGQLDVQLETAARFYEQELDYRLKKFTTLFEPAIMILAGVVVGFVAVALVQAMYGVYHQTGIK